GIACLFWQQMAGHLDDHATWTGLAIAFAGTMCFSAGNLLSSRMQSMGLHPLATYGALALGAPVGVAIAHTLNPALIGVIVIALAALGFYLARLIDP
ncbi:hypothetical protein QM306_38505, partial [Burkholderia cenocepacia]|nr:hypothetical protein [Burkholderia cenocepacia]